MGEAYNGIRDLIADLVWVALANRLRGEEEVAGGERLAGGGVTVGGHSGVGMRVQVVGVGGRFGAEPTPGLGLLREGLEYAYLIVTPSYPSSRRRTRVVR